MLSMEQLASCGVVPVVVLNDVKDAVPTAKALLRGGINVMEITFRTAAARDCIAKVAAEVPEIIAGAGTVVNVEQAREAVAAGAKFLVSPGSDPDVIAEAARLDVPIVPGVVTPSEIMMGLKLGIKVFKFFPAESYGGLKTIKALSGPFPQARFIPTGGISQANAAEYFKNPKIQAVGGSWMVSSAMIANGWTDSCNQWVGYSASYSDFVSSYAATSRPEDFAETWAYLWHRRDQVEQQLASGSSEGLRSKIAFLTQVLTAHYPAATWESLPWTYLL